MSMFDDIANLSTKKDPVRAPETYDKVVYQINRVLAGENSLLPVVSEFTKYLWTLRGRYYLLLDGFMPKTGKRLYIKGIKRGKTEDIDKQRIRCVQEVTNYSGKDAFVALKILEHEGIAVDRIFGIKEKKHEHA